MRHQARRVISAGLLAAGAAAAIVGAHAVARLSAQGEADARFVPTGISGTIQTTFRPKALDGAMVKVVAILRGPSVANVQEAAGRRLSRQEKLAIKAQRAAEQAAVRPGIEGAGGQVIATLQSALNGVKVSIRRSQIAALRQVPGVVDVRPVAIYTPDNVVSVPHIQAPFAWAGVNGVHGEGIKIGIIDTGIDYTHANFGGPGTPAAYQVALAADTQPADPSMFGPNAPKVKGGTDLVGDAYDAGDPTSLPVPDPNPLDCNSHGSHVAGTAAGFGVLSTGATFQGPYDQLTHANFSFTIGPGVAPRADLYAIRVFGCEGSTDVVSEALEWAVDNDMDVVNMSLGSSFGSADSADALAADDAMKAGVVVVSAAGNSGNIPYIVGAPGTGTKGIAVAAGARESSDPSATFALPPVGPSPATSVQAIDANGAPFGSGSLEVKVLRNADGTVSLGCDPNEYTAAGVTGKLVVTQRGICARVARAIFGQQAGAAAVVMINNAAVLPPFEGPITEDPDNGLQFTVTIPFFGVRGLAATAGSDGALLVQRDGLTIGISNGAPIPTGTASFTSSGPRTTDSLLKPDVSAPGVNIVSTGMGTGTGSLIDSGTSMATPHVAGTAALVVQAHPKWKTDAVKSAIINSGTPADLADYTPRLSGSGTVNAAAAVGTMAYAFAVKDETTVNFGFSEFSSDFVSTKTIHVKNDGPSAAFNVSVEVHRGSPHTLALSQSQVVVASRGEVTVDVTLTVPAATAGSASAFREVGGVVTFTPASSASNRGIALRVPYYLVPRVSANVTTDLSLAKKATSGVASVLNPGSAIAGTANFFAWGLKGPNDRLGRVDLRAAGVQSLDSANGKVIAFAVSTFKPWSAPALNEFDVLIDVDNDGTADFDVFSDDFGLVTAGVFNGQQATFIANLHTNTLRADFLASVSTGNSTIILPVIAADIGVTAANPRFTYTVLSFDLFSSDQDAFTGTASFNAFGSAISNGQFASLAPNTLVSVPVTINPSEALLTPALGLMIVTPDNRSGAAEAQLIDVAAIRP
jgi:subtilisin family serine protease